MRRRAVLWRLGVLAAWVAGIAVLVANDMGHDEPYWYFVVGPPLTLVAGLIVDRWWAAAVPYAVTLVISVWIVVSDATCTECGDGEGLGYFITILLAVFAVPASALMVIGVAARRLGRFFRNLASN